MGNTNEHKHYEGQDQRLGSSTERMDDAVIKYQYDDVNSSYISSLRDLSINIMNEIKKKKMRLGQLQLSLDIGTKKKISDEIIQIETDINAVEQYLTKLKLNKKQRKAFMREKFLPKEIALLASSTLLDVVKTIYNRKFGQ